MPIGVSFVFCSQNLYARGILEEVCPGSWWGRELRHHSAPYLMKTDFEGRGSEGGTQLAIVSASACGDGHQTCYDPLPLRQAESTFKAYPPPVGTYEEVTANPKLFMESLEKLHSSMRTKFMIPTIGGKELDLHRLFVEVTSRGGLERVIKDRRWKDITAVFNFPSTATNASFVLRKYYCSLLHHYEQIYFFKAEGWTPPPTAALPVQSPNTSTKRLLESGQQEVQVSAQKRRKSASEALSGLSPLPVNYPVMGVIDGKFEHGYFVTVMAGSEKLKGVLYHTLEHPGSHVFSQNSGLAVAGGIDAIGLGGARRRRRRKKTALRKKDPSHPKPNRSGYNFFFAEQHARLKPLYPGKDREISRMIGELWNKLTEEEKAVYQERGVKDKERYRSEMEEYRERLKLASPVITDAQPIHQRPAIRDPAETKDICHEQLVGTDGGPETPRNGIGPQKMEVEEPVNEDSEKKIPVVADDEAFEFRQRTNADTAADDLAVESDVAGSSTGEDSTGEEEEEDVA
ncbi:high mobility group B protein 15 isoform X1 [Nymphaea colorata]|nr:high mobility group B protein 15 isoform X1 [Nymphaea colorata]